MVRRGGVQYFLRYFVVHVENKFFGILTTFFSLSKPHPLHAAIYHCGQHWSSESVQQFMWGGWLKFFAQSYSYHKSRRQATLILVENLNSLLPCCVLPNQLFPVDWTWSNWSTLFVLCPPSTAGNNKLIKLLSPPDIHFICMPCYLSKFSCTSTAWVGQPSSLCPNVMGWGADNFFLTRHCTPNFKFSSPGCTLQAETQ